MKPLKNFTQKINTVTKQINELDKQIESIIIELRRKYPTADPEVEIMLKDIENITKNEFKFGLLEDFYNKGYHELKIGASFHEIFKKYQENNKPNMLPEQYKKFLKEPSEHPMYHFNLEIHSYNEDSSTCKLYIKVDKDKDTITFIEYSPDYIECF